MEDGCDVLASKVFSNKLSYILIVILNVHVRIYIVASLWTKVSVGNMRIFQDKVKIQWILEKGLRNLLMPSLEYQPFLFCLAVLRMQSQTHRIYCEKNHWILCSMIYTLSSKVASSIKDPHYLPWAGGVL